MGTYLLEMKHITKKYGENTVLKDMELSVKPHEIHALLGENGAGKSTLMNILFGMPVIQSSGGFEGEILWEGKPVKIDSPLKAMEVGIGMVHQEFMMIPGFTIAENIKLNREPLKKNLMGKIGGKYLSVIDFDQMGRDARTALERVGMDIDENTLVENLPVGYKQFVEISREIDKNQVRLLVFDEPTAVLTESEAAVLLKIMKKLAAEGIAIIFITHRLDEVMEVADQVTIFRDGELVDSMPSSETDTTRIAEMMIGRKMEASAMRREFKPDPECPPALELKHFKVDMPGEQTKDIDLTIYKGEILGLAGLAGQGKISIANGIMGIYPSEGELVINGEKIEKRTPQTILKKKCAFVSEDRRGMGLLLDSSIEDNIAVAAMKVDKKFVKRFGVFGQSDKKRIRAHANEMIRTLDIRCTGPAQYTRRLSGGNQQKVCVARALTLEPEILMVSEPTRGIDIGAKKLLLDYLVKLNREKGVTVIITSSELAELRSVCDRIAVVFDGQVEGILKPDASDTDYGLCMMGYQSKQRKEAGR